MDNAAVPHDPGWADMFAAEADAIKAAFGDLPVSLHHIGSTAIPGILAKPIIDMLCVAGSLDDVAASQDRLEALGYQAMGAHGIEGRRYFRKTDVSGKRTHHLHAFRTGSRHIERYLAFRDYLKAHPEIAEEYSDLKATLLKGPDATREGYVDGKEPFFLRSEQAAVAWYRQLHGR